MMAELVPMLLIAVTVMAFVPVADGFFMEYVKNRRRFDLGMCIAAIFFILFLMCAAFSLID